MTPQDQDRWMRRALELARRGRGDVEPNPMVGCVLVRDGQVIGEGWHERFGGPHAEPNALADCAARGQSPRGADAVVSLEPCCHLHKKTPPCVPALIEAGVSRVIVGCPDPNPNVGGRGVEQLRAAGVEVEAGVLGSSCRQLNAAYFARVLESRPYVTLKWAQTADGAVARGGGRRLQITGERSNRAVHELRSRSDAILVGIRTVLADDPLLTARQVTHSRLRLRVVLDRDLRLPLTSRLVASTGEVPVLVYCGHGAMQRNKAQLTALRGCGVEVIPVEVTGGLLSLSRVLDDLGRREVTHLLVEPGPSLMSSFLGANLADRAWVFRSAVRLDDPHAPKAVQVAWPPTGSIKLGDDVLAEHLNPASRVHFAREKSADLLLVE